MNCFNITECFDKMLTRSFVPPLYSYNIYRNVVICRSKKRVFELHSNIPETKLELVRDAYETCHYLSGEQKNACYLTFGLDARNVEVYLPIVEEFERKYHQKYTTYQDIDVCHLEPISSSSTIFKIGPFKFTIEKYE